MNQSFQTIYHQLEQQRLDILSRVKAMTAEKFNHSPAPGKWSVSQVLTHILVAEQLSLQYMKKKALGIDQLKNAGVDASIRLLILIVSQRIPAIKYKAPTVVVNQTPPALPLAELMARWEAHRVDLKNFVEGIQEKNVKKLIYRHVVAGRFDARQAMVFFREHIHHHLPQINRLLNQE